MFFPPWPLFQSAPRIPSRWLVAPRNAVLQPPCIGPPSLPPALTRLVRARILPPFVPQVAEVPRYEFPAALVQLCWTRFAPSFDAAPLPVSRFARAANLPL